MGRGKKVPKQMMYGELDNVKKTNIRRYRRLEWGWKGTKGEKKQQMRVLEQQKVGWPYPAHFDK